MSSAGRIPGVVMMVQRDGKLAYARTLGKQDPQSGAPMRETRSSASIR
jgi:hypothetical protein